MNCRIILLLVAALFCGSQHGWAEDRVAAPETRVRRIEVEEFDRLRGQTNTVLLDVRSKAEYEKGHIPHAVNLDINSLRFTEQVGALDKDKTYLVNCAVGMRSAKACKKMEALGFEHLYDLAPGFDGWKKARKPVEK